VCGLASPGVRAKVEEEREEVLLQEVLEASVTKKV
jgi:hypothetical protein